MSDPVKMSSHAKTIGSTVNRERQGGQPSLTKKEASGADADVAPVTAVAVKAAAERNPPDAHTPSPSSGVATSAGHR